LESPSVNTSPPEESGIVREALIFFLESFYDNNGSKIQICQEGIWGVGGGGVWVRMRFNEGRGYRGGHNSTPRKVKDLTPNSRRILRNKLVGKEAAGRVIYKRGSPALLSKKKGR